MIWLTPQERKALWEEYPEVQEMYEEYNGILPEDDGAWERVQNVVTRLENNTRRCK